LNIKDEILNELRSGRPFAEVRTRARSKSQLYEALRQFSDEVEVSLEERREKLREAEEERLNLEEVAEALKSEVESTREERRELQEDKTRLGSELSENAARLASLEERAERFRAQGFTSEILGKLEPMIATGGDALLKQVESVEKYHEAMKDFACLKKKRAGLLRDISECARAKKKAQSFLASLKNETDELRLRARPIKEAVNTVVWLLERGYNIEDVRSLGYGLDFIGAEGDSGQSVSHLIAGLKKSRTLAILEAKVVRRKEEYAELERVVEDRKVKLKILEEAVLRSMDEAGSASIQCLRQTAADGQAALTATCQKFDAWAQASMANLQAQIADRAEWLEEQGRRESELAQRKTLFETELEYGRFCQAFFVSDDFLSRTSLPWILHMSHRLHLWICMNHPKETIIPPSTFQTQLGFINWPYSLKTLAELVCLGLEKTSQQSAQPKTSTTGAE
jgi:hypothetical protein